MSGQTNLFGVPEEPDDRYWRDVLNAVARPAMRCYVTRYGNHPRKECAGRFAVINGDVQIETPCGLPCEFTCDESRALQQRLDLLKAAHKAMRLASFGDALLRAFVPLEDRPNV